MISTTLLVLIFAVAPNVPEDPNVVIVGQVTSLFSKETMNAIYAFMTNYPTDPNHKPTGFEQSKINDYKKTLWALCQGKVITVPCIITIENVSDRPDLRWLVARSIGSGPCIAVSLNAGQVIKANEVEQWQKAILQNNFQLKIKFSSKLFVWFPSIDKKPPGYPYPCFYFFEESRDTINGRLRDNFQLIKTPK
jgi:hypothetical protein